MMILRWTMAALALMVGPAWAGCDDFTVTKAPRARICFDGVCEDTLAAYQCGNINGAQYGYSNGFHVELTETNAEAFRGEVKVDLAKVTCTEIDAGACFPSRNK